MFGWTRRPARKTASPKSQTSLSFRPALDGFEDRLTPAVTGLGEAGRYAVLGVNGGTLDLTRTSVDGDIGLGAQEQTNFTRSTMTGTLYADPTAQIDRTGLTAPGATVRQSMAQASADALAASSQYAGLAPTQDVGNINTDVTITGTGGTNVIKVNNVNMGRGDILALTGGANDVFVINVSGRFVFQSGAIQLNGVTPDHVVFNVPTSGPNVQISGQYSVFNGTILAPNRTVDDSRTGNFTGAIIARNVSVTAGDQLHQMPFTPPAPGPGQGSASISGHLSGPTGDLGGVIVTLTNLDTQTTQETETGPFGDFSFTNLSAGTYSLTITQAALDAVTGGLFLDVATTGTGATNPGTAGVGSVTGIVLDGDDVASGYNFSATTLS